LHKVTAGQDKKHPKKPDAQKVVLDYNMVYDTTRFSKSPIIIGDNKKELS
jgi:hypothetical protein